MKVFVSSTCYDLLDLRTELYEDLRDLGVDVLFSDLKESEFETRGEPNVNSIETCLENVRGSDAVIVILSQRYGPRLSGYMGISATHLEYLEARKHEKKIHFYIRDRLVADWSAWKRNDRLPLVRKKKSKKPIFQATWATKPEDAQGLFEFIEEHQRLTGGSDEPGSNNWYWQFSNSVDLRADVRKRLEAEAYQATGEKMVRNGQAPILLVVGQDLSVIPYSQPGSQNLYRFQFEVVNAGQVAAMSVQGDLILPSGELFGGNDSRAGAVMPGTFDKPARITFDVPDTPIKRLLGILDDGSIQGQETILCRINLGYCIPTGHRMQDHIDVNLVRRRVSQNYQIEFLRLPDYGGKTIIGMQQYLPRPEPSL